MPNAIIRMFLCCLSTVVFLLLATLNAEPCARLYILGLDASTTDYPQLAGTYNLLTTSLAVLSGELRRYPIYRHELKKLFLYYNSTAVALMIGPLRTQSLLMVERAHGAKISAHTNYSEASLFDYSSWKQWDPRQRQYLERSTSTQSYIKPHCVDENFGYCSSGYLYPKSLYTTAVQVAGPPYYLGREETIDFSKVHFKLHKNVFHNLRPVYEMVSELNIGQRYLYHQDGKWHVGTDIGSVQQRTGIILELEGNAMRAEYENGWNWIDVSASRYRAFDKLGCGRQLPEGMSCWNISVDACDNGVSCFTDASGVSVASCRCPAGYQGIQCDEQVSECPSSYPAFNGAFQFTTNAPYYEGTITTIFCLSGLVKYSLCQNGSWKAINTAECSLPLTTTSTTTTTKWSPAPNQSYVEVDEPVGKDSTTTVLTVIAVIACVQLCCPFLCYCCVACCQSDDEETSEETATTATAEQKSTSDKHKTSLQRICSGFFYVSWWAWLGFVIIYFTWYGKKVPLDGSTVLSAVAIMAFVCLGVLYCCVFSESFCAREYNYLTEFEDEVTTGEQITQMKAAKPTLAFKADCWHNVTKSLQVQDNQMQMQTYVERETSATIEEPFPYSEWFDDSAEFTPPQSDVTKVHVELAIEFADEDSKRVYEEAYEHFKARHLARDVHVDFTVQKELPGFVKQLAVHDPNHPVPSWMSSSCYCLASCFCLTWPYRLLFNSALSSYKYRIVKKIVARPAPIVTQPHHIQAPANAEPSLQPCAPPLPTLVFDHRPDENAVIPIIPFDQLPSVPPPSYQEFIANPILFNSRQHAAYESIPMSDI